MWEVHLYVEAESITPKRSQRKTMYVLELIRPDKAPAKTKDRMMVVEDTYHAAILHTIASALAELKAKNNIDLHIHTRDSFVAACIEKSMQTWKENGYKKKDGTPVTNSLLWSSIGMNLDRILPEGQQAHGHQEQHSYYRWMMEQMKKR